MTYDSKIRHYSIKSLVIYHKMLQHSAVLIKLCLVHTIQICVSCYYGTTGPDDLQRHGLWLWQQNLLPMLYQTRYLTGLASESEQSAKCRTLLQYNKECLSRYRDSHYKDKAIRWFDLYNVIMIILVKWHYIYLYWYKPEGPVVGIRIPFISILRLRQNGCHFPNSILKCIFWDEIYGFWLKFHWT